MVVLLLTLLYLMFFVPCACIDLLVNSFNVKERQMLGIKIREGYFGFSAQPSDRNDGESFQ